MKLIRNLSYDEFKNIVMMECDHNKSPGLDGLPYELYQVTRNIIGGVFVQVLRVALQRINLIESDRHGVRRLCSKVDGVPIVSELRPVTFINCD